MYVVEYKIAITQPNEVNNGYHSVINTKMENVKRFGYIADFDIYRTKHNLLLLHAACNLQGKKNI